MVPVGVSVRLIWLAATTVKRNQSVSESSSMLTRSTENAPAIARSCCPGGRIVAAALFQPVAIAAVHRQDVVRLGTVKAQADEGSMSLVPLEGVTWPRPKPCPLRGRACSAAPANCCWYCCRTYRRYQGPCRRRWERSCRPGCCWDRRSSGRRFACLREHQRCRWRRAEACAVVRRLIDVGHPADGAPAVEHLLEDAEPGLSCGPRAGGVDAVDAAEERPQIASARRVHR